MQHFHIKEGNANTIIQIFVEDVRKEDGGGLTGLKAGTTGLTAYYMRAGQPQHFCELLSSSAAGAASAGPTQIGLVETCAGDWVEGGFVEVDDMLMPGLYELQIPDACVASGSHTCRIMLYGADNMASTNIVVNIEVDVAAKLDRNADLVESQRAEHTWQGNVFYVDPVNGDSHANGNRGGRNDPYASVQDCHDNAVTDSNHDVIFLVSGAASGATTLTEDVTITKRYLFIRGPGRDFIWTRTGDGNTITVTSDGVEICGCQISTASGASSGNAVGVSGADFFKLYRCWINEAADDGIDIDVGQHYIIRENVIHDTGNHGIHINSGSGAADHGIIDYNQIYSTGGHGVRLAGADASYATVLYNVIWDIGNDGVSINSNCDNCFIAVNVFGAITNEDVDDDGTNNSVINNNQWGSASNIWDADSSDHQTPGSMGRLLKTRHCRFVPSVHASRSGDQQ